MYNNPLDNNLSNLSNNNGNPSNMISHGYHEGSNIRVPTLQPNPLSSVPIISEDSVFAPE